MKIFYLDINEYPSNIDFLKKFADRKFLCETKEIQHCYGRFLVKTAAKDFFKLDDTEIEIVNNKPRFKNNKLQFSISHSANIVLAAFDINHVGADIEFMKERNFKEIFKRYNYKGENISKELFYKFWTEHEAVIKLQGSPKTKITIPFENNFMITVAGNFEENYKIYKLTPDGFSCVENLFCK